MSAGELSRPFDLLDPAYIQNPYPVLAELRERAPVWRAPQGYYVLSRYDDVFAALADPRFGNAPARHAVTNARNRERYVCADVAANILPFQDGAQHAADRRLLARAFHERLRDCLPEFERQAREHAPGGAVGDRVDVLADFATPFAMRAICGLFGLPAADIPRLKEFSHYFFYLFAPMPSTRVREQVDQSLQSFRAYFSEQLAMRRAHGDGQGDFLAQLRATELAPATLTDSCMLLLADGIENVDSGIANAVLALLRDAEAYEMLRADPALLGAAVEECLRLESPAQFIARVAIQDVELHGHTIKAGSAVLLMLGAANRDPDAFPDADRLRLDLARRPHLGFGRGAHACIGGVMVKAELEAAVRALLLEPPGQAPQLPADFTPQWESRGGHRWLQALPVHY